MTFHLSVKWFTLEFVKVDDRDVIGILPDFGDLVFEVEIGELSDIAGFEVVDGFGVGQEGQGEKEGQDCYVSIHTC